MAGAGNGTGVGTWIGVGLILSGLLFLFYNIIYKFEFIISSFLRRVYESLFYIKIFYK